MGAARHTVPCVSYVGHDRQRWVAEDPARKSADRDDFARDRARVLHSSALRRLSAKTQVVQPDSDDFVRNRLTHSLEVAQIGREFGAALGCNADVVDTACLAHDLGHPPFGHNGESALNEIAADFGGFEGNAQTLRLLTRLEPKRFRTDGRSAGLNLTRACLDASTKYPWYRDEAPHRTPKFGAYADDAPVLDWLREGAPRGVRCLEADIMDWSDDVAYSVHDVEDAIASGRLDPRALSSGPESAAVVDIAGLSYATDLSAETLRGALDALLDSGLIPVSYDGSRGARAALKDMTSSLIGRLLAAAEGATRTAYGAGDLTRYAARLHVPNASRAECAVLKAIAAHFVMNTEARMATQARQRELLHELYTAYASEPEQRLDADLLPDWEAGPDDAARQRVLIDQIASLTDARATALHRRWCWPADGGR